MPEIAWILYREKVVGRNSPAYADVDNRPLRQIVQLHGWDPDDASFTGLHYFPLGIYVDDINERTAGHGIHLHEFVTIDGSATIHGVTTIYGDLDVITPGRISGDIGTITVKTAFNIDALATVTSSTLNFIVRAMTFNILGPTVNPSDIWNSIRIKTDHGPHAAIKFFTYQDPDPALGEGTDQKLILWIDAPHVTFVSDTSGFSTVFIDFDSVNSLLTVEVPAFFTSQIIVPWTGIYMYNSAAQDPTSLHKIIDFGETGWSLGTGGIQQGGLIAGTDTLTTTQKVVNGLVEALFTHHKLLRA